MIEIESHRAEDFRAFEAAVADREEVTGCWGLGGGFDYLLQVVTSDIDAYQRLIDGMLSSQIGLKRYFTYIVTGTVKGRRAAADRASGRPAEGLTARVARRGRILCPRPRIRTHARPHQE